MSLEIISSTEAPLAFRAVQAAQFACATRTVLLDQLLKPLLLTRLVTSISFDSTPYLEVFNKAFRLLNKLGAFSLGHYRACFC